ncbi:hypothetical protein CHARACLAT_032854 [Characodon lateralis]|uniref:Uncharacterized protein n=1 Tax=Characodon lateralis TaxID=208331 RepID=A0ABU7E655_9TELE|nr:hypothetical protein [Characodon lateralis]
MSTSSQIKAEAGELQFEAEPEEVSVLPLVDRLVVAEVCDLWRVQISSPVSGGCLAPPYKRKWKPSLPV